jgi:hypothetical protein
VVVVDRPPPLDPLRLPNRVISGVPDQRLVQVEGVPPEGTVGRDAVCAHVENVLEPEHAAAAEPRPVRG